MTAGPGARPKINSPYQLDALPNSAVAESIAHFIGECPAPGTRWRVTTDGGTAVELLELSAGQLRDMDGMPVDNPELAARLARLARC